jgi:hypothetical protein
MMEAVKTSETTVKLHETTHSMHPRKSHPESSFFHMDIKLGLSSYGKDITHVWEQHAEENI